MICCPFCRKLYSSNNKYCPACGSSPEIIDGIQSWAPELAVEGGGFKQEYFSTLAKLEEENFWFRNRNSLIIWALAKYFPKLSSFMEIGCGTGFVLSGVAAAFPTIRLMGSEVFITGLKYAISRTPQANFLQMDARQNPYIHEVDVIGAFDVLEHIQEDVRVLSEMYEAIKPGGGLILTVPQHPSLWSAADDYACHVRRYTAVEMQKKVLNAGFEIVRVTSFVSLLLPAMFFSRKYNNDNYDPLGEFHISKILNFTLEKILQLERRLIRFGISFPIGGSLLIIGRKRENDPI